MREQAVNAKGGLRCHDSRKPLLQSRTKQPVSLMRFFPKAMCTCTCAMNWGPSTKTRIELPSFPHEDKLRKHLGVWHW